MKSKEPKYTKKETESAIKAAYVNKVFLKNITAVLPQYVFWKDVNSIYLGCNKNFAQLIGLNSPEEIIGKTDNDMPWQETGHTADTFQRGDKATLAGHLIINQEEILALPNGKTLVTLVSKLPIIDEGKIFGIVGYFTDITEYKKLEDTVSELKTREAHFKAMSAIGGMMAHELRTPLAAIALNARSIKKFFPILMEAYREYSKMPGSQKIRRGYLDSLENIADNIEVSARYASNTITTILSGFHYSASRVESLQEVDVNATVQQALKDYPLSKEEQTLITFHSSTECKVLGSQNIIIHVLHNLLKNALYVIQAANKGIITISVEKTKNNNVHLLFKDTAKGIPKEILEHIFEPFYTTKDSETSIGLGLYFCKVTLEKMNASITCESREGEYTLFIIKFKGSPKKDRLY